MLIYIFRMYDKCPKCGFVQQDPQQTQSCEHCGLVFKKWIKNKYKTNTGNIGDNNITSAWLLLFASIKARLLYMPGNVNRTHWYLYLIIYIGFLSWGVSFIFANHYSGELNQSFMHNINLVFHEAGHVIFRLFGRFIMIAGGSLLQLLVPFIFMFAFILKRDIFAASVMLWWLAQSMMDLVAYIDDAQRQDMWLLGGVRGKDMPGIHDWNNLLSEAGLLEYAHPLAVTISRAAIILMLTAFAWGGWWLYKTYRHST